MAASPPLAGKASTAVPARQRRVETKGVLRRMSARPKKCTERKPLFAKRPWGVSAEEQAGDLRVYISEGPEYAHMGQHWTEIRTCSPENGAQAWTSTISVAFGMSGQDAQHVSCEPQKVAIELRRQDHAARRGCTTRFWNGGACADARHTGTEDKVNHQYFLKGEPRATTEVYDMVR